MVRRAGLGADGAGAGAGDEQQVGGLVDRDREAQALGVEATAVLMPMTAPDASSSGPPLLPGLIAASVWIRPLERHRAAGLLVRDR